MHFCTICEIIFLVGCAWKSNVVLEKSLKNGCNVLYEPWLLQFLWCQRKCDGGGLKKNEGTCTYGVVSGRSGSGLYGILWWNGWVTRRDPGNE